jgi:hypothetical protein
MLIEGLEDYMLQCTNKELFGIECLGCGAQRATVLFLKGEFIAAFKMYPAIYTIALLAIVVIINLFVKFRYAFQIKVGLLILSAIIIIISYFIKMSSFI